MEYRKLGSAGVQVSALSFGTWLTFGKQINDETAEELMIMQRFTHEANLRL